MAPKQSEEEWFAKFEIQMIRDAKRKREARHHEKESISEDKKPDNYMLCPRDGAKLEAKHISDVEVDICPECDGLWLDRGEMEEILLARDEDKKGFFRKLLLG